MSVYKSHNMRKTCQQDPKALSASKASSAQTISHGDDVFPVTKIFALELAVCRVVQGLKAVNFVASHDKATP